MSLSRRRSSSRSSIRRSFSIERLEERYALDGKLAITELMYQPPPPTPPLVADDYEFIEVQNIGDATINLGGMSFTSGIQFTFPAVDLVPGQFAIIAKNVTAFREIYGPGPNVLGAYSSGVLSNGGERITIERAGTIITDFTYDGSWYDATAGGSFSLVPADVDTDHAHARASSSIGVRVRLLSDHPARPMRAAWRPTRWWSTSCWHTPISRAATGSS